MEDTILEIHTLSGDSEVAALFTKQLLEMYDSFASAMGWKLTTMTGVCGTNAAGYKFGMLGLDSYPSGGIRNDSAFDMLEHESGVHLCRMRSPQIPPEVVNAPILTGTARVLVWDAEEHRKLSKWMYRAPSKKGRVVRTYHFPDNRVVDHRLADGTYALASFMSGFWGLESASAGLIKCGGQFPPIDPAILDLEAADRGDTPTPSVAFANAMNQHHRRR